MYTSKISILETRRSLFYRINELSSFDMESFFIYLHCVRCKWFPQNQISKQPKKRLLMYIELLLFSDLNQFWIQCHRLFWLAV